MAFRAPIKVCFGDIDHAGIVYYPRFLHYFHIAMEEFFSRQIGIEFARVLHEYKLGFPTVRVECDFYRRLCYGDRIDIEVKPTKLGRTSITWGYKGYRAGGSDEIVAVGSVVTVCVNSETFEKVEVPSWLRDKLGFNSTGS